MVIELKSGRLDDAALHQALYYASSLARLSADELRAKLEPNLNRFGSEADSGPREIAVSLVGVLRDVAETLCLAGMTQLAAEIEIAGMATDESLAPDAAGTPPGIRSAH